MPRRDFSKVAFAATGDTNSIPTPTQPDGSVSLQQGFTFDYQRDNGAGGGTPDPLAKNIDREDMNGILNEITASIGEIQQKGYSEWVLSAAPYPINAHVYHNALNWRSTIANNSAEPGVGAGWVNTNIASTTDPAYMRFGTPAEQVAGILASVAANPAGVLALITAMFPKRVFGTKDFIRIPDVTGGFIFQWGPISNAAAAPKTETFATNFPTARLGVVLTGLQATGNQQAYAVLNSSNQSGFVWSGFAAGAGSSPILANTVGQVQGFFFAAGN